MGRRPRFAATPVGEGAPVHDKTIYRIRVQMSSHETVRNLGQFRLDYCCMPQERDDRGGPPRLHAYARGAVVTAMRKAGRKVEVLADALAEGRQMQKFISKTDRFQGGKKGPETIGKLV
jgi:hypothetical protein